MPDPVRLVAEPCPGCAVGFLPLARVHAADLDIPEMDADHPEDRAFIFIWTDVLDRRGRSAIFGRRRRGRSAIAGNLILELLFGGRI